MSDPTAKQRFKGSSGFAVELPDDRKVAVFPATNEAGEKSFVLKFSNAGEELKFALSEIAADALVACFAELGVEADPYIITLNYSLAEGWTESNLKDENEQEAQ